MALLTLSLHALCSKNEDTKSESNSQRTAFVKLIVTYCVQRTKIQNLKAIHNLDDAVPEMEEIVFKERRYKI